MKTLKSALFGTKSLPDDHFEEELRSALREHRAVLLSRLLTELPTYLDYKFHCKPSRDAMDSIKGRLVSLKDSYVDLTNYKTTCQMVAGRQLSHISSEEFYAEIDETIRPFIKVTQLDLATA